MANLDIQPPAAVVAVAASAGGVEALREFVRELPADLEATVLIVLHVPPAGPSVLPTILARAGKLPARHPHDGDRLEAARILVAPPDQHMTISRSRVHLDTGPRENGHRPAADVLMRSVAHSFGERAVGVVLSGTLDDGAAGLRSMRAAGGFTLVQDPDEAAFPGMPLAAIAEADPQVVGGVTALADDVCKWLSALDKMPAEAAMNADDALSDLSATELTPLTCPECGGTLWHRSDYGAERYRCRVGHTFSSIGLLLGKQTALETALWAAIVALEERAEVSRRVAEQMRRVGQVSRQEHYEVQFTETQKRVRTLRSLMRDIVRGVSLSYGEVTDDDAAT